MDTDLADRISETLKQKGCRITNQRRAIIEAAFGTSEHFTAERLIEMARREVTGVFREDLGSGLLHWHEQRIENFGRSFDAGPAVFDIEESPPQVFEDLGSKAS